MQIEIFFFNLFLLLLGFVFLAEYKNPQKGFLFF